MQEEVKKHTQKVFNVVKNTKHSITDKIKEISIEIFIIVFAVSFSIWIHNWSEHNHQQAEVKEFLIDLKVDLHSDIESLEEGKKGFLKTVEAFTYLTSLKESQYDSLREGADSTEFKNSIKIKLFSAPSAWRKSNCGNYEGFKSSGKIGFIENKKLKKSILDYYEQQNPGTSLQDDYIRKATEKLGDLILEMAGKKAREIIFNPKINGYLRGMIMMSNSSIKNYDETIIAAKNILNGIATDN